MHSMIIKKDESVAITEEEWNQLSEKYDNFQLTNKLKQQNPFTKEFIFMDVPGSGYWVPSEEEYKGWPEDGSVWFRPKGNGFLFIQFGDSRNEELNAIASTIGCKVVPC